MSAKTLKFLAVVVLALAAVLFVLEKRDKATTNFSGELLFPTLKDSINNLTTLTITGADDVVVHISNSDGRWIVDNVGYPASVGKIRDTMLALADAKILEEKTSDSERYAQLGVQGPGADESDSMLFEASSDDKNYAIIFGKTAQQSYRYVRKSGEQQSLLVDRNPDISAAHSDWLLPTIIDIDAERVESIKIEHADGEVLTVRKSSEDETDFSVENIPDGRELSYGTVANGIGGALDDLELEDVRTAEESSPSVVTQFSTFDGLTVVIEITDSDNGSWFSFAVQSVDSTEAAESINVRVSGWQYRLSDSSANLLKRRWDDVLKDES